MSVTPEPGARERAWHALSAQKVASSLDVDPARGLSAAEAERRLGERGPAPIAYLPVAIACLKTHGAVAVPHKSRTAPTRAKV